jgi:hypothetical protein
MHLKLDESYGKAIKVDPGITGIVDFAYEGGTAYQYCYAQIEALDLANQK